LLLRWQGSNLAGQQQLLALLRAGEIGITLSDEDQPDPEDGARAACRPRHPALGEDASISRSSCAWPSMCGQTTLGDIPFVDGKECMG